MEYFVEYSNFVLFVSPIRIKTCTPMRTLADMNKLKLKQNPIG